MSSRSLLAAGLALASLLAAGDASAAFHAIKIVEVMAGPGSYVNLEMYFGGQTQLTTHSINVYDAADNLLDTVALATVAKGEANSRILIGTSATEATFGVKPDFATMKTLPPGGGKVCFDPAASAIDCFSWGNYPNKVPTGAPYGILSITTAAKRKVSGGATAGLDGTEDTDSSLLDFAPGTPTPKNNAGATSGGPPDAGGSTTSSSSSSSSSSTSSSGGNPSSASSSSGTSGVTTNPSSSASSSSNGAPIGPTTAPAEDEGCNTAGDAGGVTAVPLLALLALVVAKRRRRA